VPSWARGTCVVVARRASTRQGHATRRIPLGVVMTQAGARAPMPPNRAALEEPTTAAPRRTRRAGGGHHYSMTELRVAKPNRFVGLSRRPRVLDEIAGAELPRHSGDAHRLFIPTRTLAGERLLRQQDRSHGSTAAPLKPVLAQLTGCAHSFVRPGPADAAGLFFFWKKKPMRLPAEILAP